MGQRYPKMEDQKSGPGLACNLDFAKEKGLERKVMKFPKMSKLEDVVSILSKLVQPKRITDGGLGAGRWAIFCKFLEKMAILIPFG